jgi:uncharacterized integral membrane protein
MTVLRWIIGACLFVALLFLSLQNAELVTLRFYHWWSWQAPLVFVVLIAFAVGVAAGLMAGAVRSARLNRQLRRARRAQQRLPAASTPYDANPGTTPASGPGFERTTPPLDGV